jgi:hypothetical protein
MPNTDDPNEPTVDLSQEAPKTTPVLEQILEGINALREEVAGLREELRQFKEDTHANFLRVENAFEAVHDDLLRIRADDENRIEEIERKAS